MRSGRARLVAALATLTAMAAAVAGLTLVPASPAVAAGDPCGPTGNVISCENSLPGTPQSVWDVDGAGDSSIQGFATDISVNAGSTIDFKIDTNASAYSITIYRTGYYGGDGARQVASVSPSASLPQTQPACITDPTTELYDCGNWGVSASWAVPSTAVSGIYFARLNRPDRNASSMITFIVRNDASRSDLVFQTSDPTWQAYNTYGGSSFYQGAANGRAYKLSYNRPFATRSSSSGRDFYFANEYPMVRFLEKNGYDVSYIAGVDTDRAGSLLLNHKTFLSVGHDEYWSKAQRSNVEAARDAGVNLQFLSGNEVYWKTRYEASSDASRTAYRTLVTYKETWNNAKIDPSDEWTGTWRDPRFAAPAQGAGVPENRLTGQMYMVNSDDLALTVSAAEGKNRLWRNTSLATLASGTATLAPHTIGYESDEDVDNGSRPPGLIRLSTTTGPVSEYLQDFGSTVSPGTTNHHLTMYRASSGALVFGAGTIQWSWGLDAVHDSPYAPEPADPRMQQAQVNLLADMGAQPTTLDTALVAASRSTDTTGPSTTITGPGAGAAVANGTSVTVTGTANDDAGRVAGVEVSTDGGITWHPATGTSSWSYTYVQHGVGPTPLRVRAVDDSANIGATATQVFDVACPCSVLGSEVPATSSVADVSSTELGLRFSPTVDGFVSGVRFFKGSGNTGTHVGSLWSPSGQRLSTVTFTGESATGWQTASFPTSVPVTAGQTYVVSYTAPVGRYAVKSYAFSSAGVDATPLRVAGGFGAAASGVYGNAGQFPGSSYQNANYYVDVQFTTVDGSPLTATNQWPVPGSSSVSPSVAVSAALSKAVVTGTAGLALRDSAGVAVAGTTSYDATSRVVTFTPSGPLAGFVTYTATLSGRDNQGNDVSAGRTWSFTTARPAGAPGVCPCSLFEDATTPTLLEDADRVPVTLGVRFTSDVAGSVTGVRFYKGLNNTGTHTGTLWSAAGVKLAEGTFTGESTTGWQTLTFDAPVAISRNTAYVASYRTEVGRYSATPNAFASADLSRAPLRVTSSSGAYTYGTGFPSNTSPSSYLVDLVFERTAAPFAMTSQDPAPGAVAVPRTSSVTVTFSDGLAPGASMQVTQQPSGTAIAGSTVLGADGATLSFQPATALPADSDVRVVLSGVTSTDGVALPTQTWTFHTQPAATTTAQSLFTDSVPQVSAAAESSAVELGTVFSASANGSVTGIRFFKGAGNLGTHTGSLWTSTGTRLATVTFTGESASGWQTAAVSPAVPITAGTSYVVSYLAPQGHYSYTSGFFSTPFTVGDLTAPATNNGRYLYGAAGGFPTFTYGATNYFVDVVFERATSQSPALSVTTRSPASGATNVARTTAPSITFSAAIADGYALAVRQGTTSLAGAVTRSTDGRTLTFTPSTTLPASATLTVTASGISSTTGASLPDQSWSFTTAAPSLSVTSRSPAAGATNVARTVRPSVTFSAALADGYAMTVRQGTTTIAGSVARSVDGRTLTFTPAATLPASTSLTVSVSGLVSTEGATLATQSWSFTTRAT